MSGSVSGAKIIPLNEPENMYTVTVNTGTGGEGSIRLNLIDNDSIEDADGTKLGGTGIGNGNFTGGKVYIFKNSPFVNSITRNNSNPTNSTTVEFEVDFSEPVTGVTKNDFWPDTTGSITGAGISAINGSGSTYIVTVNTGAGDGTIQLALLDQDSIIDGVGNKLGTVGTGNSDYWGEIYDIYKSLPFVLTIMRINPNPISVVSVDFSVTFSEPVIGVDMVGPQLDDFALLTSPGISGVSITNVGGSATTYTVTVNTGSGTGTIRLDMPVSTTISDLSGNPLPSLPFTNGETYTITEMVSFSSIAANDGWTLESSEYSSRANARNNSRHLLVGDDAKNKQYRPLLYFDTSSLPDNAVITNATLRIMQVGITGTDPFATHGALFAEMKNGFFGKSPLENTDFQAVSYPKRNAGNFASVNGEPGWYELVLNPVNLKYVNLNGATQFRIRFTRDDNNDKIADFISFYSGDGPINPPQLIVEYIMP